MLYNSKYQKIWFDEPLDALSNSWTEESREMSNEEFKEENLNWLALFEKYQPKNILADTRTYYFIITIKMQDWHAENIFSKLITFNPKKMAMIVSSDFFAQISIEQTIEEGEEKSPTEFQTRYFGDEKEAQLWLLK